VSTERRVEDFAIARGTVVGIVRFQNAPVSLVDLTRPITDLGRAEPSELILTRELTEPRPCVPTAPNSEFASELERFARNQGYLQKTTDDWDVLGTYAVEVIPLLYAPILQFSSRERVLPAAFEIWESLNRSATIQKDSSQDIQDERFDSLLRAYDRRQEQQCTVYHHRDDEHEQPGSWVVQFWLYYPFDIGGTGSHAHDSEHLFVEVDKLGGSVRRVVGAGHGNWAPNNIYTTYLNYSLPVKLPLYAIVELGKHATAPDIDRDGFFTPGLDSNNDWDAAKVWGIRDTTGVTDSNLRAYSASMMARRDIDQRRVPSHFLKKQSPSFATLEDKAQKSCVFQPLSAKPGTSKKCNDYTSECAASHVLEHTDFEDIREILKPAIYPPRSIRLLFTRLPTANNEGTFTERSIRVAPGFALEFSQLGLSVPGRIALDVYLEPPRFGWDGFALRYETMASNLFGYYAGFSYVNDDLKDFQSEVRDFSRKQWITFGALFEMPLSESILKPLGLGRRLTFNAQAGLMYNNYYRLNWDARLGFAFTFRRPNSSFGITAATPNPY
jgi:hypothetical protein